MKKWTKEERYRVLKDPSEVRDLYDRIRQSDYRQTFHIQPVTGLLNDPNGFVFHDGEWHLFYQWCPWGAVHGLKYWYHVVSLDLVTWKNLGVCVKPDTVYDNKGAYSGSALPTDDSLYLYYTGNHRDEDWKRTSYTCLIDLRDKGTPVKADKPLFGPNPDYTEHQRDPKIIYKEELGKYFIILGAQTKDKHGCILIYSSDSPTKDWSFAGQLKVPGFENFGDMWECPSIEHIRGTDVLLFCPQHLTLPGRGGSQNHNGYLLGEMDWNTLTFTPDSTAFHVLDFGFDSYAAECAANPHNTRSATLVAWMGLPDSSYPTDEEDWQGCLTLPRELTVRGRRLIQQPLDELRNLRDQYVDPEKGELPRVCEMEIIARGGDLNLTLFTKKDGSGGLKLDYDDTQKTITIDRSGMDRRFNQDQGESRTRPLPKGLFHLRIFIDRSSIEIFVNDGDAVFTSRIFPTAAETGFTVDGDCSIHMWTLRPAVKDDFVV